MRDDHHAQHEPAPEFPPRPREGQQENGRHGKRAYSVCTCGRLIAQFRERGRWVESTTPNHPYLETSR